MEADEKHTGIADKNKLHPCFNVEAKSKYGRVHLPVAPNCNVQCNYCNRKFDCVNESRPGVSSAILAPANTPEYVEIISKKGVELSVVGIAGPGDPFANIEETFETIRLVKEKFPDMLFCLSSNGIDVAQNIDKIVELGISHVTITMNAIDAEIAAQIYSWVRFRKKMYRGLDAGKIVIDRQTEAIKILKKNNIVVKINSIILPGINDHHIIEVAKFVAALGADTMNCIPLYPTKDTAFEDLEAPSKQMVHDIQRQISQYITPMKHCARCRADAAGLLGQDIVDTVSILREVATKPTPQTQKRPYVAVGSNEGMLVNQHLGEVTEFMIFANTPKGYEHIDTRPAPKTGLGDIRWIKLAKTLDDCNTILVSGVGSNPMAMLKSMGIAIIQMNGLIEVGLDAVYKGKSIAGLAAFKSFKCGDGCAGSGTGCG